MQVDAVQEPDALHTPFRVAYFEAGKTWAPEEMRAALMAALAKHDITRFISLPPELFVSVPWNMPEQEMRQHARALMSAPDVSAILAVGLVGTRTLLLENNGRIPVIAVNLPDAVDYGIVEQKTGQPVAGNFSCFTGWDVHYTGIIQTSKILPFTSMGFLEDISSGQRQGRSVRGLREAAREVGFALQSYTMREETPAECRRAVNTLIDNGIDAFILPQFGCFNWVDDDPLTRELLETLTSHNVITIGTTVGEHVRKGAAIGLYSLTASAAGEYFATQLIRRLKLPAEVEELPLSAMRTVFNIDTANRLHLDIPIPMLLLADGIMDTAVPQLKEY